MEFIADTHVHLYSSHDLAAALRGAMSRLAALAPGLPRVLCLTERSFCHFFREHASGARKLPPPFSCYPTGETALTVTDNEGEKIFIIAGRQVATLEKLEVHSLACDALIPERLPIADTIEHVIVAGGIPVIPWGLGKWLWRRGRIVREMAARNPHVFLGDSSMRPTLWPEESFSAAGKRVFAGSDSLPVPGDEEQIGTYATVFSAAFDENDPSSSLRAAMKAAAINGCRIVGRSGAPLAVLRRQLAMNKAGR